jgi:2-alkyl-3-oxoalkanoate reductase
MTSASVTIGVTGATGFIGRHLIEALRRDGARVRALTRQALPIDQQHDVTVTWVPGHLDDTNSLSAFVAGCDGVIHLAGAIKALSRDEFLRHNATGTRNLVQAVGAMPAPARFICVSSLAAREPRLSNYALSKRESEKTVRSFAGKVPLSIIRPPAVYGPGDQETLRIFKMAARGFVLTPPDQSARLSLIHVEDLVSAILNLVAVEGDSGEPLEVDDGRPRGYSWPDIVAAASEAMRVSIRTVAVPAPILQVAGAMGTLVAKITGKPSTLSWDKVPEVLHADWVVRGDAIPGWKPRWTLQDGFKDTVNAAVSRGLLKSYS